MPSSSSLLDVGCCFKGSDLEEGLEWFCVEGAHLGLQCCCGEVAAWVTMRVRVGPARWEVGCSGCGRCSDRGWGYLVGGGGSRRLGIRSPHAWAVRLDDF